MVAITALLTPWYRRLRVSGGDRPDIPGSTNATPILDLHSVGIRELVARAHEDAGSTRTLDVLAAAHAIIRHEVRPVYSLDESRSASRTLARGAGSCSQRLAILESVARSIGVPTRVRALLVDRSFWYPRFPRLRAFLPDRVLLAWPEFAVEGGWRGASELFGPIGCHGGAGFANRGAETLFEAVGRCAVDWDGVASEAEFDLSRFVRVDFGRFTNRDDAFLQLGQTLCAPSRFALEPILGRVAA
jgi:transglutaminase-like putative cysteine protease